jgi:ADP-heptose:LPS heptosyltransferase
MPEWPENRPAPQPQPDWLRLGPAGGGLTNRVIYSGRARVSRWTRRHLAGLSRIGARVTVRDLFGSPGDTLLTATVCRHLKQRWPGLRLNCITKNPDLLLHDTNVSTLNGRPGLLVLDFWYLDLLERRDNTTNVLRPTLAATGVETIDYRARVYLTPQEREWARGQLKALPRPRVAFNQRSAQPAKNWAPAHWDALLGSLRDRAALVQLGDQSEPVHQDVTRFAGRLSRRESMAILGECDIFIGPDSFLMHAANGLDVPATVIYGGRISPAVTGYAGNRNLYTDLQCSGCWLTGHPGSECPHNLACLDAISVSDVLDAAAGLLRLVETRGPSD